MPNLIEVQKDSYQWFLDEGLKEVFDDISPITDYNGRLSLNLVISHYVRMRLNTLLKSAKKEDATYAAPLLKLKSDFIIRK